MTQLLQKPIHDKWLVVRIRSIVQIAFENVSRNSPWSEAGLISSNAVGFFALQPRATVHANTRTALLFTNLMHLVLTRLGSSANSVGGPS